MTWFISMRMVDLFWHRQSIRLVVSLPLQKVPALIRVMIFLVALLPVAALAQDGPVPEITPDPLAELARIEAQACLFEGELTLVPLRRVPAGEDANERLELLGELEGVQVSEGGGRIIILSGGNILQIDGDASFMTVDGEMTEGVCGPATGPLHLAIGVALGNDPRATFEALDRASDQVTADEMELLRLQAEVATLERSLEEVRAEAARANAEAERQMAQATSERLEAQDEVLALQAQIEAQTSLLEDLRVSLADAQSEVDRLLPLTRTADTQLLDELSQERDGLT